MEQFKAVVNVLEDCFPDYKVYTEKVNALGNLSCFYVKVLDSSLQKELNDVYRLTEKFEIIYYDVDKSDKSCFSVNEDMDYFLRNVGGLRGKRSKSEVKNGALKAVYEYSYRVRLGEVAVKEKMNGIKIGMEMVFDG